MEKKQTARKKPKKIIKNSPRAKSIDFLGDFLSFEKDLKSELKKQNLGANHIQHFKKCCAYKEGKCTHYPRLSALRILAMKAEEMEISCAEIDKQMNTIAEFDGEGKVTSKASYQKGSASALAKIVNWKDVENMTINGGEPETFHFWDYAQAITSLINFSQSTKNHNRQGGNPNSNLRIMADKAYKVNKSKFNISEASNHVIRKYEEFALGGESIFTDAQRDQLSIRFEMYKSAIVFVLANEMDRYKKAGLSDEYLEFEFESELARLVEIDKNDPENVFRRANWEQGLRHESFLSENTNAYKTDQADAEPVYIGSASAKKRK